MTLGDGNRSSVDDNTSRFEAASRLNVGLLVQKEISCLHAY